MKAKEPVKDETFIFWSFALIFFQEVKVMRLKDTGLTAQDIKDKVSKYMIDTYERFDFIAETAKDMYMYDENGTPYLDFYAGIAVNSAGSCNEKVVEAVKDQVSDI